MSTFAKNSTNQSYHYPRPATIKSWRADVAEALYDAGLDKVADRWLSCSESPKTKVKPVDGAALPKNAEKVYVCSANHHHEAEVYSQTCDLRICPECARRQAARLVHRYLPLFLELAHRHHRTYMFRHIVFTSPYSLTDSDIRARMLAGFKQVESVMSGLMAEKCPEWKKEQGYLVGAEFGEEGRKLHYHVIHYGRYLPQPELSRKWREATGGEAYVVFVRGFPYPGHSIEETLREVLKYCVKFYSQDEVTGSITAIPAELMPLLCRTLDKTRRIRTAGLFYNVPEPERSTHSCETCGGAMVALPVDYFVTFCNTGFMPPEWNAAKSGAGLNSRPADKSSGSNTGISPPDPIGSRQRQIQMDIVRKLRWAGKDVF